MRASFARNAAREASGGAWSGGGAGPGGPRARNERLLLARIEIEESKGEFAVCVANPHDKLPARAEDDLAVEHRGLDLHRHAGRHLRDRHYARLVLIAQRQVQDEIEIPVDADPGELVPEPHPAHSTTTTASASTSAPRGSAATPTAARAG